MATPTIRTLPHNETPIPADVQAVIDAVVAAHPHWLHSEAFVVDKAHGDVHTDGAFQIGYEGDYDWPWRFTEAQRANRTVPATVFIEPGAGWWLGVYPA